MFILALALAYFLYVYGARNVVLGVLHSRPGSDFWGHALCMASSTVLMAAFVLHPVLIMLQEVVPRHLPGNAASLTTLFACCLGEFLYGRIRESAISAMRLRWPEEGSYGGGP
jgi:hypothetical protein